MYGDEHVNKYNKAASHGLCATSEIRHIHGVEHVIMISQFLNLSWYVKLSMFKKYHKGSKTWTYANQRK